MVRADRLNVGDTVEVKGQQWTVTAVQPDGKFTNLTLEGRRGSFSGVVRSKTEYRVTGSRKNTVPPKEPSREPVLDRPAPSSLSTGAVNGYGDVRGGTPERSAGGRLVAASQPATTPQPSSWEHVRPEERAVVDLLGARLVAVEDAEGRLIVPPVTDGTVLGHLVTMHGVRYDGVPLAEAKRLGRLGGDVLGVAELDEAFRVHDRLHADFSSLVTPHWHEARVPA